MSSDAEYLQLRQASVAASASNVEAGQQEEGMQMWMSYDTDSPVHIGISHTFSRSFLDPTPELPVEFTWNDKKCSGTRIHKAVLDDEIDEVRQILEECTASVTDRFRYSTENTNGVRQEGSGQAIHIAASRGHLRIMELLFEHHASVDAEVTRDNRPHYQVIHGAIFAEGRGGCRDVVDLLLAKRASLTPNQNGQHPLHLAFRVGSVSLVKLLRQERQDRGMEDIEAVERKSGQRPLTPLEEGIQESGMSRNELVEAAPLEPISLHVFSRYDPNCIPRWLQRFRAQQGANDDFKYAEILAKQLHTQELIRVLERCPLAADAILKNTTSKPKVSNIGLHPLPPIISFEPQCWTRRLFRCLNPTLTCLPTYQTDKVWAYDGENFREPDWHDIYARRPERKMDAKQVDIMVSHIPDLASAEFFLGIAQSTKTGGEEALVIFDNPVVEGLIQFVWWESVCQTELMHIFLNVWGLLLLCIEQYRLMHGAGRGLNSAHHDEQAAHARSLRPNGNGHVDDDPGFMTFIMPGEFLIANDFMIARGVFLVWRELTKIIGAFFVSQGLTWSRFMPGVDLFKASVLISLFFNFHEEWPKLHLWIRIVAMLIHWWDLFDTQFCAELMASALLPLMDLLYGLMPSLALTLIGYCSFTHVRLHMMSPSEAGYSIMIDSFMVLFTGTMPESGSNDVDTAFCIIWIVIFTLFFLNIFIGVISELYQKHQAQVNLRYRQLLCGRCLRYMLRYRCMPKRILSKSLALALAVVAVAIPLAVQVKSFAEGKRVPCSLLCFGVCMVALDFCSFANPNAPWVKASSQLLNQTGTHLWIAQARLPIQAEDVDRSKVETLEATIKELQHELAERKEHCICKAAAMSSASTSRSRRRLGRQLS